jgi:hypothetical protein
MVSPVPLVTDQFVSAQLCLLLIIFSFTIHQTEVLCQLERAAGKPSGRAGRWRLSEFVFPALDGVASSSLEHVFVVR